MRRLSIELITINYGISYTNMDTEDISLKLLSAYIISSSYKQTKWQAVK
jgi:hypothetical protein